MLFCIKAFVLIVGGILALSIIAAVVAVISFLIGGSIVGMPFHIAGTQSVLLVILLLLVFVLPVFIVIYLLMKLVFDLPSRKTTLSVLFGIWILILIYIGVYVVKELRPLGRSGAKRQHRTLFQCNPGVTVIPTPTIVNDTVRVETVSIGDSTATDTVRIEYYTE